MDQETQTPAQNDTEAAGTESSANADAATEGQDPVVDSAQTEGSDPQADQGEGSGEADTGNGEGDAAPEGAPEQYADFTTPEGYELSDTLNGEFKELAKSMNLTQEQAQQFIEIDAKRALGEAETAQAQWKATTDEWAASLQNDAEMGGAKYEQSLALANKAIDNFGTPELRAFLDESGLGTHPELLRAFHKVGNAISEDRMVSGEGGDATTRPFYANSNMK